MVQDKFTTSFPESRVLPDAQLHDLRIEDGTVPKGKPQERTHSVKPLSSCCPRIQVEPTPAGVLFDHQQMRVPTDKQRWPVFAEPLPNSLGVAPWPATDVRHPNGQAFPDYALMFGKFPTNELIVDVSMYSQQGSYCGQRVGHGQAANVSGMPYFIASRQMMEDAVVDVTVGVTDESNAHGCKLATDVRLAPSWRFPSEACAHRTV